MKYPLFWAGLVSCLIVSLVTTVRGEPRTWTATDGREIEAEYISSTDTSVKVRITSSRQEYDIPLDRLSQQDRDWIAEANKPKPIEGEYAKLVTGDWVLENHGDLPYGFYGSTDFSADEKYPLVITLHGKSQNNENGKQLGLGKKFANETNFAARPCFVLSPLCYQPFGATGGGWDDKPGEEVIDLVSTLVENLPIDPDRIYLLGFSMGGFGVCHLMSVEPDLFAAGVAIAGYEYGAAIGELKKEPIWLFQAADDPVVEVDGARAMAEELKRSKVFKYTEFETGGHGISGQVLDDTSVHEWLFEQRNE
ncbi:MAG: hypothetical protein CMO55_06880 [Verrucomicrobiales bacterium]|nr:hypothetical protein [Verrucomicrobiales bacterium]